MAGEGFKVNPLVGHPNAPPPPHVHIYEVVVYCQRLDYIATPYGLHGNISLTRSLAYRFRSYSYP